MNEATLMNHNSSGWNFFTRASFGISILATAIGIIFMPSPIWVKGYMSMGVLFVIGSTIMLSKTTRDEFEAQKILNRIKEAKTQKMLKEFDDD